MTAFTAWGSESRPFSSSRVRAAAGTLPRVSQPVIDQSMLSLRLCTQTPPALVIAA
ncbi:hypothetical protein D9M73_276300 [compost metagenome]